MFGRYYADENIGWDLVRNSLSEGFVCPTVFAVIAKENDVCHVTISLKTKLPLFDRGSVYSWRRVMRASEKRPGLVEKNVLLCAIKRQLMMSCCKIYRFLALVS